MTPDCYTRLSIITSDGENSEEYETCSFHSFDVTWVELIDSLIDLLTKQGYVIDKELLMKKVNQAADEHVKGFLDDVIKSKGIS